MKGKYLEHLTWPEAETALRDYRVSILPIGARTKEHGFHLPLNTDWLTAEYLTKKVLENYPALALPTMPYGYYPAFEEYPGSISINEETFKQTICDICRSVARFEMKRIYILNTGISTIPALESVRSELALESITIDSTDLTKIISDLEEEISEQECGTHADELETSMLLAIHPELVKMDLAEKNTTPRRNTGRLTRDPKAQTGIYSPSGVWGDPTLATKEKGELLLEALVTRMTEQIEALATL